MEVTDEKERLEHHGINQQLAAPVALCSSTDCVTNGGECVDTDTVCDCSGSNTRIGTGCAIKIHGHKSTAGKFSGEVETYDSNTVSYTPSQLNDWVQRFLESWGVYEEFPW